MSEDFPKSSGRPTESVSSISPLQISALTIGGDSVEQYYSSPQRNGDIWTAGQHSNLYALNHNVAGGPTGWVGQALVANSGGTIALNANNNLTTSVPFDYQTGTFTPVLTGSLGDPATLVQTGNGSWTIIGNIVSVNVSIDFTYGAGAINNVILLTQFPNAPVNLRPFLQYPATITDGFNTNVSGFANPLTVAGTVAYPGYMTFTVGSGLGSDAEFVGLGSPSLQRIRFSMTYIR